MLPLVRKILEAISKREAKISAPDRVSIKKEPILGKFHEPHEIFFCIFR